MEIITDNVLEALGQLLVAGIILIGWSIARSGASENKFKTILWKGFLWCAGLALFGSIMIGSPSCEQGADPVFGGCEQYADDGYEPTTEQRVGSFIYGFILLYIPVVFGAIKGDGERIKNL